MALAWFDGADWGDGEAILRRLRRADPAERGDHHRTALMHAVYHRREEAVRELLRRGADVNARDSFTWTALTWAAELSQPWAVRDPSARIFHLLTAAGGRPGLREAVLMGDVELARDLCYTDEAIDVDANARWGFHDTHLMVAAGVGHRDMVDFLLDRGARPQRGDDVNATPLMRAARGGHEEVVARLLDRGAPARWRDILGHSALSEAAVHGHEPVARRLIDAGAEVGLLEAVALGDVETARGLLPGQVDSGRLLRVAARSGRVEMVELLLGRGADINAGSAARIPGRDEIRQVRAQAARWLRDRGADAPRIEPAGQSPLMLAAARGHLDVVRLLAAHGADASRTDPLGETARSLAEAAGHREVAAYLARAGARGRE